MTRHINLLVILAATIAFSFQTAPQTPAYSLEDDIKKVKAILKIIDDNSQSIDAKMSVYDDAVVHMAQGSRPVTNKADLRKILEADASYGKTIMKHELVTIHSYHDMVLTRGRVTGTYYPRDGGSSTLFETNNIITFQRKKDGSLKIWQVIFNRVNLEQYAPSANK